MLRSFLVRTPRVALPHFATHRTPPFAKSQKGHLPTQRGLVGFRQRRPEGDMGWVCRAVMACFMVFAVAACATVPTTPMESQSKPQDPRMARLYFIWPHSFMFRTRNTDIKINEQVV